MGEEVAERHGPEVHARLAGLDAGQVEQLFHEVQDAPRFGVQHARRPLAPFVVGDGAVAQGLRKARDGGERRFQFVRHVDQKLAKGLLRLLDGLGHLVDVPREPPDFARTARGDLLAVVAASHRADCLRHALKRRVDRL